MSLPVSPAVVARSSCRVVFGRPLNERAGAGAEAQLGIALPVLAGSPDEALLTGTEPAEGDANLDLGHP